MLPIARVPIELCHCNPVPHPGAHFRRIADNRHALNMGAFPSTSQPKLLLIRYTLCLFLGSIFVTI
jgi:hypothetical protein